MKIFNLLLVLLFCFVFLFSCRNYKQRAVDNAREFALEKLGGLPETDRDYIKFAPPEIFYEPIFYYSRGDKEGKIKESGVDFVQACIIWDIPDMEDDVIVFGTGEKQLRFWTPERLIVRKMDKENILITEMVRDSRDYVMQNMLYLPVQVRNDARFAEPEIRQTDFQLNEKLLKYKIKSFRKEMTKKVTNEMEQERTEAYKEFSEIVDPDKRDELVAEKLADIKSEKGNKEDRIEDYVKNLTQYSLVWHGEDDRQIVVTGVSAPDYSFWKVFSGLLRNDKKLMKHTVKTLEQ